MSGCECDCECAVCDSGFEEFWKENLRIIDRVGWCVIGVPDNELSFSYTVGNSAKNLPELLTLGLHPSQSLGAINHLCQIQRDRGYAFKNNEIIDIGAKVPLKAIVASSKHLEYTVMAQDYAGTTEISVVQILIPDRNGIFPDDPKCEAPYCNWSILGLDS